MTRLLLVHAEERMLCEAIAEHASKADPNFNYTASPLLAGHECGKWQVVAKCKQHSITANGIDCTEDCCISARYQNAAYNFMSGWKAADSRKRFNPASGLLPEQYTVDELARAVTAYIRGDECLDEPFKNAIANGVKRLEELAKQAACNCENSACEHSPHACLQTLSVTGPVALYVGRICVPCSRNMDKKYMWPPFGTAVLDRG
jgi:hypothetical protein